jgi:hypothetical protein
MREILVKSKNVSAIVSDRKKGRMSIKLACLVQMQESTHSRDETPKKKKVLLPP